MKNSSTNVLGVPRNVDRRIISLFNREDENGVRVPIFLEHA
jgi:hypothetical protein